MPLLKKSPFVRQRPPRDLREEEEVFYCEATKEVFWDYEEFFQRTILCNSMVWSCSITGKSGLTYEEAVECERKAKKRLGSLPKPLKRGLLWLTDQTKRGRISDLVDDVYVFAFNRFFKGQFSPGFLVFEAIFLSRLKNADLYLRSDWHSITHHCSRRVGLGFQL